MDRSTSRRVTAGVLLAVGGLLLFLAVGSLRGPGRAGGGDDVDRDVPASSKEPPAVVGDRGGSSHAAPRAVVDGADGGGATAGGGGAGDAGGGDGLVLDGPVGEVTAIDLETVALVAPPPGVSLVAPRFSPAGTRLLASTGKGAVRTLWVMEVDHTDRGWTQLQSAEGGLAEPAWLDESNLVAVMDGKLVRYVLGGDVLPLVGDADEVGKVAQPAVAPGGEWVAWTSIKSTNGGGDLRLLERSTGVVTDLTASGVREADPAWRADGRAVVGTVAGAVTAYALDARDPLARFARNYPGRSPGFWGDSLVWQEGEGLVVDLIVAAPGGTPRVIARRALPSVDRPAPIVAGFAWVAALTDRGTVWAVRQDGSGVAIDSDAAFASQPDVVERPDGIWLAFTSAEADTHTTRIHVGRLDRTRLGPIGEK